MPQASKTFRIFVSSTFSDLKAERNALQEHVFPRLRELCEQHGCRFQAIDLRWGIRDEAALDQQTMKICLEEIARCQRTTPRPNFIVLLGDRYGWRPLPAEIPASEFDEIQHQISQRGSSPSDESGAHQQRSNADRALLERWYKRDDNAVPPVYCLQPREGEYAAARKWEAVENRLRGILLDAIGRIALLESEELKYLASATEREIVNGALNIPDARKHVFCFFRKINDFDFLAPQGRLEGELYDAGGSQRQADEARASLLDLKERLRRLLGHNVHEYRADWRDGLLSSSHIGTLPSTLDECLNLTSDSRPSRSLCEDVWRSLSGVILEEIARLKEMDPLETEAAEHELFGTERAKHFVGRTAFLEKVTSYVGNTRHEPWVIFGASGSGKSAFMARAAQDTRRRFPKAVVITRFIGSTPASSDGQALLDGVCREISRRLDPASTRAPADYESLILELPKVLSLATADKPIVVFLDALDQFSSTDNARKLKWLPAALPDNARVVVSTTPGDCLSALETKVSRESLVELLAMPVDEGGRLLDLWLKDVGRTLLQEQRQDVLERFSENGLPLYLKLAFEEARRWPSFRGRVRLEREIPGIIRDMFRRLEGHHGKMLVSHGLGYLAAARNGLTEDEILDVLALDEEFYADFKAHAHHDLPETGGVHKLPVALWSRLYFDLEPYLTERSVDGIPLLSFYHRQLSEAVMKNYLAGPVKRERHRTLAQFFGAQELTSTKDGKQLANVRKVSELPFHQTHGEIWRDLEQTLCDFDFVEAKCAAGRTYDLAADYEGALLAKGFKRDQHPGLAEFARFVRSQARVLAAQPALVFQLAVNETDKTRPAREAIRKWERGEIVQPWLRSLNKSEREDYFLMRLEGHTDRVSGCAFSPDGDKILSASAEGTLKLWDTITGEELATMQQSVYGDQPIFAIDQIGARIVSANSGDQVRVWDARSGAEISTTVGKWGDVMACGFTEGGKGSSRWPSRSVGS